MNYNNPIFPLPTTELWSRPQNIKSTLQKIRNPVKPNNQNPLKSPNYVLDHPKKNKPPKNITCPEIIVDQDQKISKTHIPKSMKITKFSSWSSKISSKLSEALNWYLIKTTKYQKTPLRKSKTQKNPWSKSLRITILGPYSTCQSKPTFQILFQIYTKIPKHVS